MEDHGTVLTIESRSGTEKLTIAYVETAPPLHVHAHEQSEDQSEYSRSSSSNTSETFRTADEVDTEVFETVDAMRYHEEYFGYTPLGFSMSMTGTPGKVMDRLKSHCTYQLFTFLISHLLAHTPDDPVLFLIGLLEWCQCYRDRGGSPPLLFDDGHIRSLYTALDPADLGTITYKQYLNGMTTLGLADFDVMPEGITGVSEITKGVFLCEAKCALLNQLDLMLGKPQPVCDLANDATSETVADMEGEYLSQSSGSMRESSAENVQESKQEDISESMDTENMKDNASYNKVFEEKMESKLNIKSSTVAEQIIQHLANLCLRNSSLNTKLNA